LFIEPYPLALHEFIKALSTTADVDKQIVSSAIGPDETKAFIGVV